MLFRSWFFGPIEQGLKNHYRCDVISHKFTHKTLSNLPFSFAEIPIIYILAEMLALLTQNDMPIQQFHSPSVCLTKKRDGINESNNLFPRLMHLYNNMNFYEL